MILLDKCEEDIFSTEPETYPGESGWRRAEEWLRRFRERFPEDDRSDFILIIEEYE